MSLDRGSEAVAAEPVAVGLRPRRTFGRNLAYFVTRKPLGTFGAAVAIVLILVAALAPVIATHDPYRTSLPDQYNSPGAGQWFGGDHLGRDVFSRIVYGARISLYVGVLASSVGSTIGMTLGVASVQLGGKTDLSIQRVVDALMAFPGLILAIAIMSALGASVNNVVVALSIAYIPSTARIVRSQALAIKEMDYVLAARAIGAGNWRIMLRHMVPNIFALYLVVVTFHLGGAIIAEGRFELPGGRKPDRYSILGRYAQRCDKTVYQLSPMVGCVPWARDFRGGVRLECAG